MRSTEFWNEQLRDEGAYARAAWNLANASIAMSNSILKRRPDTIFINSESSEFYQPCCPNPDVHQAAAAANDRRFLPLDLIYAHPLSDRMHDLLCQQGISTDDINGLGQRQVPQRSILGVDYYEWNERLIDPSGKPVALGELFGWYVIANQYWERYRRPMMHTETNKPDAGRRAAVAVAAVVQCPAASTCGRAPCGLHLVQPDRSDRLEHCDERGAWDRLSRRVCSTSIAKREPSALPTSS